MFLVLKKIYFLIAFAFCQTLFSQNYCEPASSTNKTKEGEVITYYYKDGPIQSRTNYLKGLKHGSYIYYYPNGKVNNKVTYCHGKICGPEQWYYENGKLSSEYDGQSTEKYFSPEGKKYAEIELYSVYGRRKEQKRFYETGEIERIFQYDTQGDFRHTGKLNSFYKNGTIKKVSDFKEGRFTGNWKSYYENGTIKEIGECLNESSIGNRTEYNLNGNIKSVSHFVNYITEQEPSDPYEVIKTQGEKLIFNDQEVLIKKEEYLMGYLVKTIDFSKETTEWSIVLHDEHFSDKYDYDNDVMQTPGSKAKSTGIYKSKTYYYNSITNSIGDTLLKNGSGEYLGPYFLVKESINPIDSVEYYNYQTYENNSFTSGYANDLYEEYCFNLIFEDWKPYFEGEVIASCSHCNSPLYAVAHGNFKNGLKEGEWLEGSFSDYEKYNQSMYNFLGKDTNSLYFRKKIYAKGMYRAGKKEGVWKLFMNDLVYEGKYINDKREGEWKLHKKKNDVKNKTPKADSFKKYYINGQFKNGQPDGIWQFNEGYSDKVFGEKLFSNGTQIGSIKSYYSNLQLRLKAEKSGDTLITKYYSPLGDEIDWPGGDANYSYSELKNGIEDGKYYSWDNDGNIISKGTYKNGTPDGVWEHTEYLHDRKIENRYYYKRINKSVYSNGILNGLQFTITDKDTTFKAFYTNGILNGEYYEAVEYSNPKSLRIQKGTYKNDKRTGSWIDSTVNVKEIEFYGNGWDMLIDRWEDINGKSVQVIKNGEGVETHIIPDGYELYGNRTFKLEYHYKNGKIFMRKDYHKDGALMRLEYIIPKGDSLATYNSAAGVACVSSGEGIISDYDPFGELESLNYYEGGKLQKCEYFEAGLKTKSKVFFLSKSEIPLFKRKITKLDENLYNVEININSLSSDGSMLKIIERLPNGYTVEIKNHNQLSEAIPTIQNGQISFVWANNIRSDFSVNYILKVPQGNKIISDYDGELKFVKYGNTQIVKIKVE